jgi:hypothetical protein
VLTFEITLKSYEERTHSTVNREVSRHNPSEPLNGFILTYKYILNIHFLAVLNITAVAGYSMRLSVSSYHTDRRGLCSAREAKGDNTGYQTGTHHALPRAGR